MLGLNLESYRKMTQFYPKMPSVSEIQDSKQCPFCGHREINVYSSALSVRRCLSCGLLFRSILQLQSNSAELYKNAWSDACNHINETGGTNLELARIYLQKLILFLGKKNLTGLKILDFGAGRGDILIALSELGADIYGIEPYGYEYLKSKGLKVFRQIEEIPKGLFFDAIITTDVIEHIPSPWDAIGKLYKLLNTNGWLYIATPNANSLNARFFKSHWREFYNPSHFYFFNSGCIEAIFIKLGIVEYKRLYWFIKYSSNFLQNLIHFVLKFLKLDGELRYILRKV